MPLKTLTRIKDLRVERAERQNQQAQGRVQLAKLSCEQGQVDYQRYRLWRKSEETRLFEQCQAQPLNRRQLEQWQQQVASLREQEAALEQHLIELDQALAHEREQLKSASQRLVKAQYQVEKFRQFNQQAMAEEKFLLELKEEQELTEFRRQETPL